jgi:formylglycine-generating enzyme required for sulfatase activity
MLQAKEFLCILLLVASVLPEGYLNAQTEDPVVDDTLNQQHLIDRSLAAAQAAMQEGRVDQPRNDCAWSHYQAVLEIDPENAEAQQGLIAVQQALVSQAIEVAQDLDFELAERILEDAALVRGSRIPIIAAQEEIAAFRSQHVGELEARAVQAMDAGNFPQAERILIELIALGGADSTVRQLRQRLEEARIYGGFKPGQVIREKFIDQDLWTPESVIILAGSYMMGSSTSEDGRKDNEGPRHRVVFRRGFAIGRTEVSVKDFRLFKDKTGYSTDAERHGFSTVYNHHSARLAKRDDVSWEMNYEGKKAEENEPVVHVSWNDANAYVQWLARATGKPYRLPSEAEFEYVLRAGGKTKYWWGDGVPPKPVENLTGEHDVSRFQRQWSTYFENYEDKFWGPAPVASFDSNPFGLHDIAGNVAEWVRDCWHDTYLRAPVDGSAWLNPGCKLRIIRGGYWASAPDQARSAFRLSAQTDRHDARLGFRIARDL